MLIEHGYQVTMKTSSKDVVAMFKEDPDQFDLVITDQTMPELFGIELAEELLKIRPDMPIILCSGYGTEDFAAVAKQVGIREFCKKPLKPSSTGLKRT
jgi:DNA-binding NtrC family response regulator